DQTDISAYGAGAVYMFSRIGATWHQDAYIKASNTTAGDFFGEIVALSRDGRTLAVTPPNEDGSQTRLDPPQDDASIDTGAVYLFVRPTTTWMQAHYVKALNTGARDTIDAVGISADGSVLVVGAPQEDSSAMGFDGDQASNAAMDSGAI